MFTLTQEDLRRLREWRLFVEEISTDSDRGALLALATKIEAEAKATLAKAHGQAPITRYFRDLTFAAAVAGLERLKIVAPSTAQLLNQLRYLRNRAAHSPRPFHLLDNEPPAPDTASNRDLVGSIVDPLRGHIDRVRGDDGWTEHEEEGVVGDAKIAARLLWECLEIAGQDLTPVVADNTDVVMDLINCDPERFCVVTTEELEERREQAWLDHEEAMNAEYQALISDEESE